MKRFDGIHKYSYNTIFGIFTFDYVSATDVVINQVTQTLIQPSKLNLLPQRRFDSRAKAYHWLKLLECVELGTIRLLFEESAVGGHK